MIDDLLRFVQSAPVLFPLNFELHQSQIFNLVSRYSDVPMSFADACLVQLSELYPDAPNLTLDSDFLVYRRKKREPLPLILPKARDR